MKNFITKTVFFVGMVSVIVILLNNVIPTKSQIEKDRIDSLLTKTRNIESLTFGRSHAASLDYRFWAKNGFNLALGGRDFASINYLLHYLVPKTPKLSEVIIFVSYSSFYFDNTALAKGNLNDARKALYYSIPSIDLISNSDISNYVFGKVFPFIQADHGYSLLKKYLSSNSKMPTVTEKNRNSSFMDSVEIIASAKKQADRHSFDRYTAESYTPDIVDKNKEILVRIVDYLQSENIEVVFVTSAYYKSYTEMFPPNDIYEMKNIMNSISYNYNVDYIDMSNDSVLSGNNIYYHNADHLNEKGREVFTNRLKLKMK